MKQLLNKNIKDNLILFVLCLLFFLIGICCLQNEVQEDDWYVCSSVDGLFGEENVSFMVVCSNYVITGLTYILSLTGIRINWFLVINIFLEFIVTFLLCKSIFYKELKYKYLIIITLFIIILPYLFTVYTFTCAAAYIVAGGAFWLIDCIRNKRKAMQYFWGILLILLGFSIRNDVAWLSIFFFGIVWLMDTISLFLKNKKEKKFIFSDFPRYLIPFSIVFAGMFFLYFSQVALMEVENPGFYEWNKNRSLIDDYPLPDYKKYKNEYEKIGISYSDYKIIHSWNGLDSNFFTTEKYKEIIKLKDSIGRKNYSLKYWIKLIIKSTKGCLDNVIMGMLFFLLIHSILYNNKKMILKLIVFVSAYIALIAYFTHSGRFIQRVEWSIWYNLFFIMILFQADTKNEKIQKERTHREKILFILIIIMILFGIRYPIEGGSRWNALSGKNLIQLYRYEIAQKDNIFHYVYNSLTNKKQFSYRTHNKKITDEIWQDKSSFYFVLFVQYWLEQYPLPAKDILRTSDVGTASNWGALGQYFVRMKPVQNNLISYGINNPFYDIINDKIKVVIHKVEAYDRTKELNSYIKEHYHPNVCFSIYEKIDNAVIGKYNVPFDTTKMKNVKEDIALLYGTNQLKNFFSVKLLGNFNKYKEKYLQVIDSQGNKYAFVFEKGKNIATFYHDILDSKTDYTVEVILKDNNDEYQVIKSNKKYKFENAYIISNLGE